MVVVDVADTELDVRPVGVVAAGEPATGFNAKRTWEPGLMSAGVAAAVTWITVLRSSLVLTRPVRVATTIRWAGLADDRADQGILRAGGGPAWS